MRNDVFKVRIKRIDKPSENLFCTSNMPVIPNDGDCLYIEENGGHTHKYIVESKNWVVSSLDDDNVCLLIIWVRDPSLSK